MSADLLITALVLDEDREVDYEAADRAIVALDASGVLEPDFFDEDPDERKGLKRICASLRADLRTLHEAIEGHLEFAEMNVRGATLYVTGGLSWGDSPTEVWLVIARLRSVRGVLAAAGFEHEPDGGPGAQSPAPARSPIAGAGPKSGGRAPGTTAERSKKAMSEKAFAERGQRDVDYRVAVAYTFPVEVIVDLREGRVDRAVAIHEGIAFDETEGARQETTLHPIPTAVARGAIEIAEAGDWPVWEHGY